MLNPSDVIVRIPEMDMRPSLWREYDKHYPGYFASPNINEYFIPLNIDDEDSD